MRNPAVKAVIGLILITGSFLAGNYNAHNLETESLTESVRAAAGGSYVRLRDGITHYEVAGPDKQPTVVLVHGFSVPYYIWDPTFDGLVKAGFTVVRYDLYGRGYSDRPDVTYDADLYDRQLTDLLNALGVTGKVDLGGLSMGGAIVVTFAARHPEKVRSLALFDPAYMTGDKPPFELRVPLLGEYVMDVKIAPTLADDQRADLYHPERFPDYVDKYRPQMKYHGFRHALLSTLRDYLSRDMRGDFHKVGETKVPVLLVWGRHDTDVPFALSRDVLKDPQAQFLPVDDAAHIPHYEHPEIVNPALIKFLGK